MEPSVITDGEAFARRRRRARPDHASMEPSVITDGEANSKTILVISCEGCPLQWSRR